MRGAIISIIILVAPDSLSPLVTPLGSKVAGPQAVIAVIGAFMFAKNINT